MKWDIKTFADNFFADNFFADDQQSKNAYNNSYVDIFARHKKPLDFIKTEKYPTVEKFISDFFKVYIFLGRLLNP